MSILSRTLVLFLLMITPLTVWAVPAQDAADLFRDEVVDAPAKLKWRGPDLSDETRFAVAASGLSWQPLWGATQLIHKGKKGFTYGDSVARANSFTFARRSNAHKEAFAFALSVVLDPPANDAMVWSAAFEYLAGFGDDFDKALVGVLHAPDRLPLLSTLQYSAAEVLVRRSSPRLLPQFLMLAESEDAFLRSRAVTVLGIIGFRSTGAERDSVDGLGLTLRELGISARQQAMIAESLRQAADDKNYRVREAAAFALGLAGGEEDLPRLEKLSRDPAYIMTGAGPKDSRPCIFPVRHQAAQSLRRLGKQANVESVFKGKLPRGSKNVTNDQNGIRKDQLPVALRPVQW
jgi:hypothetical protein